MKALATMEKNDLGYAAESVIRFEEGLIGFPDCKNFVVMENEDIAPFRRLQSTDRPEVGFLVIDPEVVLEGYHAMVPVREWEALGLTELSGGIALVICIIGPTSGESTGNLQAPLVINYQKMVGKQIILTESPLSSRHPLL